MRFSESIVIVLVAVIVVWIISLMIPWYYISLTYCDTDRWNKDVCEYVNDVVEERMMNP